MMFYTIQCPESHFSQIVHRTTIPFKLGCDKRWVTLRFNIVVLYRSIYILSTWLVQRKSSRRSFFGLLLKLINSFCQANYHCVLVELLTAYCICSFKSCASTSIGEILDADIKVSWQTVNKTSIDIIVIIS